MPRETPPELPEWRSYIEPLMERWKEAATHLSAEMEQRKLPEKLHPATIRVTGAEHVFSSATFELARARGSAPVVIAVRALERKEALNEDEPPIITYMEVVIRPDRKEILLDGKSSYISDKDQTRFAQYIDQIIEVLASLGYQDIRSQVDNMVHQKTRHYILNPTESIKTQVEEELAGTPGYLSAAQGMLGHGSIAHAVARREIIDEILTRAT